MLRVHDIIVIGASAAGVEAILRLVRGLSADLPAAIFMVVHTTPTADGLLPWILRRKGPLPATEARDGEAIRGGHIYVAAPDHHLTLPMPRRSAPAAAGSGGSPGRPNTTSNSSAI